MILLTQALKQLNIKHINCVQLQLMVGKYSNKIDFAYTKGNGLMMDQTAF